MNSKITIKEIANELEVSSMTVSRAINNHANINKKTKQRVLKKVQEMGYVQNHLAKSLATQKSYTIGVVIPKITDSFYSEVIQGIEEVTRSHSYQPILSNTSQQITREKKAVKKLMSKRVDGILISTTLNSENDSFYKNIISNGPEIVFFDRCVKNTGASCVSLNDRASGKHITNHLIEEHGISKIVYLGGPKNNFSGREVFKGYLDALRNHDIPVLSERILEAEFKEEAGYKAINKSIKISSKELPEAVIAVNDRSAIGAINALEEFGLSIPNDIAVVGFSNENRSSLLNIPFTTVHRPAFSAGKKAMEKLVRTMENNDESIENIEVLTNLKIRRSCGCT